MANWHPASESPVPPPWFVRELRKIDPRLRVVWGMERYLHAEWAIERKLEPEEYWRKYNHVVSDGGPRFVEQLVFDDAKPIKNDRGETVGVEQVGVRNYDLAPEYDHIIFKPTLDQALLDRIKQLYWEHYHPEEAAAARAKEDEDKQIAKASKKSDLIDDGIDEVLLETRKEVQFGYGGTRSENK